MSSSTATTMGSVETLSSFLVSSFVSATAATAATSFFSCLGWNEAMTIVVKIVVVIYKRIFFKKRLVYSVWVLIWKRYDYREDNKRENLMDKKNSSKR